MFWVINISSKKRVKNQNSNFKKYFLKRVANAFTMYYNSNCKGRLTQLLKSCRSYKDKASCRIQHPVIYAGCFRFVKRIKIMTWRIVHVCQSERMQLKLDNLLIKKMGEDYVIPLSDISIIVAEGGETVVTLRLLSALSKYNIALIVCDN